MLFTRFSTQFALKESLYLVNISRYFKANASYHSQPQLKLRTIKPIYPPPGLNLQLPDWKPEEFLLRIGGGCSEYADKFETLQEIFNSDREQMKEKGIPIRQRKYIFRMREMLRRGVLTFEYLQRRTTLKKEDTKKK